MKKRKIILVLIFCIFGLFSCSSTEDGIFSQFGLFSCSINPFAPIEPKEELTHDQIYEEFVGSFNFNEVTGDLFLPSQFKGAYFTYESHNEQYLTSTGKVTKPENEAVDVTMTIHLEYNGVVKDYDATFHIVPLYRKATIAEVYASDGKEYLITGGNLIGSLGNTLFIQDNSGSLTIVVDSAKIDISTLKKGDYIQVRGKKLVQNSLVEFNFINYFEVIEENFKVRENENISRIPEFNIYEQGKIVNLHSFKVVTPLSQQIFSSSYKMILTDGIRNVDFQITNSFKAQAIEILRGYKRGNYISLYDVAITCKGGSYYFYFTDSTSTILDGLFLSEAELTVPYDTPLNDALKDLSVSVYNNGLETVLSSSDYRVEASNYIQNEAGDYIINIIYQDYSAELLITVKEEIGKPQKDYNAKVLEDVADEKDVNIGFASTGNVNALVIPLTFTNYSIATKYPNYATTLQKAFNGVSSDTGWESLKSYYYKSSYGKLNFNCTILDPYNTNTKYISSAREDSYTYWIVDAINYYDNEIDYSQYDSNNDGSIDCIYFVYMAPYDSYNDDSLWWAFTSKLSGQTKKYDGKKIEYHVFMSYEFFASPFEDGRKTGINCETLIHETGHALGLNDYYDYYANEGRNAGSGSGLMMDYNVGDHDAYSKAILGWTNPYIAQETCSITLGSFEQTGDCLIIPKSWNGTYFDEYYIIDYYTPTGVNDKQKGYNGLCSTDGIRIFKINAALASYSDNPWDITKYNNSKTSQIQIEFISATGNTIKSGAKTSDSDLFQEGRTFSPTSWVGGISCGFTLSIDSISNGEATLTVTYQ